MIRLVEERLKKLEERVAALEQLEASESNFQPFKDIEHEGVVYTNVPETNGCVGCEFDCTDNILGEGCSSNNSIWKRRD